MFVAHLSSSQPPFGVSHEESEMEQKLTNNEKKGFELDTLNGPQFALFKCPFVHNAL